jgi:hypothetical protein
MNNGQEFSEEFVDDYLFGKGLTLANYFIRETPYSETLCYTDSSGKDFYMPISNDELNSMALKRLRELGVKIEAVSKPS